MNAPIPNLWPDDMGEQQEVTPKAIMLRQGQVLRERTRGRVMGEVQTKVLGRDFTHTFFLSTPGLDGYKHFVLRIRHSIEAVYPLKFFTSESDDTGRELVSEEQFYLVMRKILQDPKTVSVVRSLIAQSE